MAHPLLSDPFVAAQIEDAVAPFSSRLDPFDLAWMRDQLALLLQTDGELAALLSGAHPRTGHAPAGVDPHGCMDASGERGPLGIDVPDHDALAPSAAVATGDETPVEPAAGQGTR